MRRAVRPAAHPRWRDALAAALLCLGAWTFALPGARAQAVPASALASASAPPSASPSASAAPPSGAARVVLPADLPLRRDAAAAPGDSPGALGWLVLLALAGLGVWAWSLRRRGAAPGWLRRLAPAGPSAALHLLSSRPLAPHASLHLVRWGDRELLLGCTPQAVTLLESRPCTAAGTAADAAANGGATPPREARA